MDEFIPFQEFIKSVNFSQPKTYRVFDLLRKKGVIKEDIHWKKIDGVVYVNPTVLFTESQKLKPNFRFFSVNSSESSMDQGEFNQPENSEFDEHDNLSKSSKDKGLETESKMNTTGFNTENEKREIIDLLKDQVKDLKEQRRESREALKRSDGERAFLMRSWQTSLDDRRELIEENDSLRQKLLTAGVSTEQNNDSEEEAEESETQPEHEVDQKSKAQSNTQDNVIEVASIEKDKDQSKTDTEVEAKPDIGSGDKMSKDTSVSTPEQKTDNKAGEMASKTARQTPKKPQNEDFISTKKKDTSPTKPMQTEPNKAPNPKPGFFARMFG